MEAGAGPADPAKPYVLLDVVFAGAAPALGTVRVTELPAESTTTESPRKVHGRTIARCHHYRFAQNPVFSAIPGDIDEK